jgi:hypothetical protein
MKFELDRPTIIKLGIIGVLLLIAPFVVPFVFELVLFADIMGLEALILFLIYQFRHVILAFDVKLIEVRKHISSTILLLASMYVFQPRICISHAAGSSLILLFACSLTIAMALWVPAIYLSVGGFT